MRTHSQANKCPELEQKGDPPLRDEAFHLAFAEAVRFHDEDGADIGLRHLADRHKHLQPQVGSAGLGCALQSVSVLCVGSGWELRCALGWCGAPWCSAQAMMVRGAMLSVSLDCVAPSYWHSMCPSSSCRSARQNAKDCACIVHCALAVHAAAMGHKETMQQACGTCAAAICAHMQSCTQHQSVRVSLHHSCCQHQAVPHLVLRLAPEEPC